MDRDNRAASAFQRADWPGVSMPHPGMKWAARCYVCQRWIFADEPRQKFRDQTPDSLTRLYVHDGMTACYP